MKASRPGSGHAFCPPGGQEAGPDLIDIHKLLFWSPTASGKQVLQQFLRLKAAAELAGGNAKGILEALRADLAQGRPVEIAGYMVSPRLASGLEQASLDAIAATSATDDQGRLEWLELSTRDDAELSPVAKMTLTSWTQAGGNAARGQVVQGPAFWQTTEGDSTGEKRDFQQVTPDIAAAIDTLQRQVPSVKHVVLWGLCDAASAALLYCHDTQDARVRGLCLLNPWVRSEASLARAHVKHYYVDRIRQRDFWRKLLGGKVAWSAVQGLWRNLRTAMAGGESAVESADAGLPYQDRMAQAWKTTAQPIQLLLSGEDYTAKEFVEYAAMNRSWQGLLDLPDVTRLDIAGADHTLSTGDTQQAAESLTLRWLNGLAPGAAPQPTPR